MPLIASTSGLTREYKIQVPVNVEYRSSGACHKLFIYTRLKAAFDGI